MTKQAALISRRGFLRSTSTAGLAASAAFTDAGLARMQAAGRRVAEQPRRQRRGRRDLLARNPAGLHARPHDHQPEQRRLLPEPARRARGAEALPRHLEPGARVPHVADPRAEHRERAPAPRRRVRLRSRGARHHAQRQRGAADRTAWHRPQGGRRSPHHQSGLRPHARHLGTARAARRHQADEDLVPGSAEITGRPRRSVAWRRSRRRRRSCTSATSPTSPDRSSRSSSICDEARRRGIKTVVDGAHAFAHFPYKASDLGCDYYGTSLHKWLLAPIGTGFLYVRRENIASLWPLTPASATKANDIRKFEEIGTHPAANHNAIAEALTFHEGIGIERKAARLRYLRDRWAKRLTQNPEDPAAHEPGPGTVVRDRHRTDSGVPTAKVVARLWERWRIIATPIVHAEYEGATDHAERLHDARRDRHLRRGDGRDRCEKRGDRALGFGLSALARASSESSKVSPKA